MAQAGGSRTVSNDVSAITPEIWSETIQIPLYKTLVAMDVANLRLTDSVKYGDTVHVQYFDALSAQTYVPGTAFTAQAQDWHTDSLIVSAYKTVAVYVDDVEEIQANVSSRTSLQTEIAYQLRDAIDTHVLTRTKDGTDCEADDLVPGGVDGHAISATTANIISIFSKARQKLRTANVTEAGDWIAILSPAQAQLIESKATSVGYNVADATLRNGYAGDFMGFKIYVSNNVPTGTSPSGDFSILSAQIDASYECAYIGKSKCIDVVLQKAPTIQITKVPDMHGWYVSAYTVYGDKVFTKNSSRFLGVPTVGL